MPFHSVNCIKEYVIYKLFTFWLHLSYIVEPKADACIINLKKSEE